MVNSRDKGKRAEYQVRDLLREHNGLNWERVPGSGGFSSVHGLKGDLYVPGVEIKTCIEVKHFKEDSINSNLLKNPDSQLGKFWAQTCREAKQINKTPLLIFKKDRGQWIVATREPADITPELIYHSCFRENKHEENTTDLVTMYDFKAWLNSTSKDYFTKV